MIYIVGPGHGAPAIIASLWLEGSLEKFEPKYSRDQKGLHNLITRFSTPSGFPSHISAETPGSIHEGGELGYALSVAFGAVMDKPDLVVACVVGDGEAEVLRKMAHTDLNLDWSNCYRLAWDKIHRPKGIWSSDPHSPREWLQNFRENS